LCHKRYEQGALCRTYCFLRLPLDTSPSNKGLSQHSVTHPHVSDCLLYNPTWEIAVRFTVMKNYLRRKNNDLTDSLYHITMSVTEYDVKPVPSSTSPSILRNYFHKLIFILLHHYFLCHPKCPSPPQNEHMCACVVLLMRSTCPIFYHFCNAMWHVHIQYRLVNPLKPELNPICYLLALLAHRFLHVSRIRVKSLTLR